VRKLVVLGLLALLLLNVAGYYFVYRTAIFHHQQSITNQFDNDKYETSETELIKIPLSLAYPVQDNGFERVDGKFQYKGEFYRLIKQRFYQDTLHIICIRDKQQKNIEGALTDYVKTFSDNPADTKSGSKVKIDFIKDYILSVISTSKESFGWCYSLSFHEHNSEPKLIVLSISTPPPEA
jgi:hypothetical protein